MSSPPPAVHGYPAPPVAPAPPPPPLPPTSPRPYTQVLRGVRHRWWRPLVSTAVVLAGIVVGLVISTVAIAVGIFLDPGLSVMDLTGRAGTQELLTTWWVFVVNNLFLAFGIPLAMLAVWAGHAWRPRWVLSVVGTIRWRYLGEASLASLVLLGLATGLTFALDPATTWAPERDAVIILVAVLLTTPFQAAGEELIFRGWLSQAVGSWFAGALVGAVVAGGVSAALFALAHGSQGPWLFADRFAFGVVASILAWRTGGLEAGIAAHTLNNMVIFVPVVLTGQLAGALDPGDATWVQFASDVVVLSLLVVVLDRLARRRRLVRTTTLPVGPVGPR